MATTTPNYGWTVPTSTDLVKDGATAIETLGDAVDATVFANANAAIAKTIVDAKGDIIAATAADTVARLAVGANDTVLTADSSTATGLKWATPSAGGFTAIATTTLNNTATSYTYSSLGSYKHIVIVGTGLQSANAGTSDLALEFNGDTGSNYYWTNVGQDAGTVSGQSFTAARIVFPRTYGATGDTSIRFGSFIITIPLYGSNQYKQAHGTCASFNGGTGKNYSVGGYWNSTSAITSIKLYETSSSNFKAGTFTVYGVN